MMEKGKTIIYVFADWKELGGAQLLGTLSAQQTKGRKAFSFTYNNDWLKRKEQFIIDQEILLFPGAQYPEDKENFGAFLDSMPDTWGRTLLKRRAAQQSLKNSKATPSLNDIDYLLEVHDKTRMGALRFKTEIEGDFLDNDDLNPTPPWASIRELQDAAKKIQDDRVKDIRKWLTILIAPGSSLGGARPKANIVDEKKHLWIAKFPSKNDTTDKAAWEFLAYKLAIKAGIKMSPCRLEKISGDYHTFFTKRFDRDGTKRIHFASAMTMTGNNENTLRNKTASYLDIAEFIIAFGADVEENLHQLWRRIVFNICISNTDDHLRNHGFILKPGGWVLSPAYDLNPSTDKNGLSLNIDLDNNALDVELAKTVGPFFRLSNIQMNKIINEVLKSVQQWKSVAKEIGISRSEQNLMQPAFRI